MASLDKLMAAAEGKWLDNWAAGPTESFGTLLPPGAKALDFSLPDQDGTLVHLGDFWADGPALLMFWRHFGCSCGRERAARLVDEAESYNTVGLNPVVISQAEPERAANYRKEQKIPYPILCDPDLVSYRAYGVGQWAIEQVMWEAPDYYPHTYEIGVEFQNMRRNEGIRLVDDPWRAMAEFVVGQSGSIRLSHQYQHCEDFPHPAVLRTAAYLADS